MGDILHPMLSDLLFFIPRVAVPRRTGASAASIATYIHIPAHGVRIQAEFWRMAIAGTYFRQLFRFLYAYLSHRMGAAIVRLLFICK